MGGQAVVEGVMMRGSATWAVAVRKPEGDIEVVINDAANWAEKWSQLPLARGIATLGESLSLGFKALMWSAERQLPEDEREKMGKGATGATIGVAVLMFAGLFLVLPALAAARVEQLPLDRRQLLVARRRGRHPTRLLRRRTCR